MNPEEQKEKLFQLFERRGCGTLATIAEIGWNLREWMREVAKIDSTLGQVLTFNLPHIRRQLEIALIDSEFSSYVPSLPTGDDMTAGNLVAFIEGIRLPGGSQLLSPPGPVPDFATWKSLRRKRAERLALQLCDDSGDLMYDWENESDLAKIMSADAFILERLWDECEQLQREEMPGVPLTEATGQTASAKPPTCDEAMMGIIGTNQESWGWTAEQFSQKTGFARSTIVGTNAWKVTLKALKAGLQGELQERTSRKGKG